MEYEFPYAVTVEKTINGVCLGIMWLAFLYRRVRKVHPVLNGIALSALALIFCWVVLDRFTNPHPPVAGRPTVYWYWFGTHVGTGIAMMFSATFQIGTGLVMLYGGSLIAKMLQPYHKWVGYVTLALANVSFAAVFPL